MAPQTLIDSYRPTYVIPGNKQEKSLDSNAKFVAERFEKMANVKLNIRSIWQGIDGLYNVHQDWIIRGEDWNQPVRFPTLRDFIKSLTDKFMQDPPEALLHTEDKNRQDGALAWKHYIDGVKDSIHEKKVRRQCIDDMFFFGLGLREIMFLKMDKNGKTVFNDVGSRRLDPRNWFVDEAVLQLHDAMRMEGARDAIYRRFWSPPVFYDLFKDKEGFNIDGLVPVNYFQEEFSQDSLSQMASSREMIEKSSVEGFKGYEYYNQEDDIYSLVVNGQTVYEEKMTECKGTDRIPVAQYSMEPRHDSYWPTTLGELIAPHIYLEDTLINLEIMNLKLTLQPVLAMSADFGYNPRVHTLQPGGVWVAGNPLTGKITDNVTPIIAGNPKTNFYNFNNLLQSRYAITTRSDVRNLETDPDQSATQTAVQSQTYNAHNDTVESINEVEAEGILTELMIEITKSFLDEKDEDGNYKRVKVEGYVVSQTEGQMPKFLEQSGATDFFDMTGEVLNTDVKVQVKDKRSKKASDSEKLGRMAQFIPLMTNIAQLDPQALQKLDLVGIIEQIVDALGMDTQKTLKLDVDDYADEYELVKEEILLGNDVDVPDDETRMDSYKRIKFLIEMLKKYDFKKDYPKAQKAWDYHLKSALANISANQITKQAALQEKQSQPQGQPQQGAPQQPQGQQMQPVQAIPTPDKGLINTNATKAGIQ